MLNWQQWERTHIKAVDLCAEVISEHRKKSIPIKALHLWPDLYKQFLGWTEKNLARELAEGEKMEFDGVNIEIGTRQQATPVLIELFKAKREKTDYQKWLRKNGNKALAMNTGKNLRLN